MVRGVPHRIGLHGMPIVRTSDYRANVAMLAERSGISEGARRELEEIGRAFANPASGFVYVIDEGADDSPFKVGWSYENVERRLASLQIGNPRRLRVVVTRRAPFEAELRVHKALADANMTGEWFSRTPRSMRFLIVAAEVGYREALECLALEPR